jgi:hypothetical protein
VVGFGETFLVLPLVERGEKRGLVVRGHGLTLSSEVAVLSAVPVPSAPTQAGG